MKTLKDFDFKDKKVIVRVDYNVPVSEDGTIRDDTRIKATLSTINYLLDNGVKQLILMTHVGRPKNKEETLKTGKIAARLSELLGSEVVKVDGWSDVGEARIVMLENLRFNPAEKSKDEGERDKFGKQLAGLADVYVNEAFSNSHRKHASMTSVVKFIPGCAGIGLQHEVETITNAVSNPEKPVVAIIGGVKKEKIQAIKNLLGIADSILIGGTMIFWLLKAKGEEIGDSKVDEEEFNACLEGIKEIMDNEKIVLPADYMLADKFSADAEFKAGDVIEAGWMALDIGPKSIELYKEKLKDAKTVLWFGPIGVFEFEKSSLGTKEIASFVADLDAVKVVGGGESGEAIEKLGYKDKMSLVSTGGGASLKLVCGEKLVAVEALK